MCFWRFLTSFWPGQTRHNTIRLLRPFFASRFMSSRTASSSPVHSITFWLSPSMLTANVSNLNWF